MLLSLIPEWEFSIIRQSLIFRVLFVGCELRVTGDLNIVSYKFDFLPFEGLDCCYVGSGSCAAGGCVQLAAELLVEESFALQSLLQFCDALVHLGDFGLPTGEGFPLLGYAGVLLLV